MTIDMQTKPTSSQQRATRFRKALLLSVLVLVCFIPRAWLCIHREVICSDAVVYMSAAQAFEQGNWNKALEYLNLNIFPPLLVALRHTGLEWTTTGAWWSVIISSLAALPLFGLFSRMFDNRVAVISCLLYAGHPFLLVYSPLMLRDPSNWFLFILTLYLIWRAATEVRWHWFIAAGISLTLAVHLRSEAWLLLLPLFYWAAWRWFTNPPKRWQLAGGTLVSLAIIPVSIILVNLTVLADHPRWEWGCMRPLEHVQQWAKATSSPSPSKATAEHQVKHPTKPKKPKIKSLSTTRAFKKVTVRMVKAFTYAYGFFAIISLWIDRRELLRPKNLPLLLVCLVLFLGLTIRLTQKPVEPRYFLIIVILALPRVARGMILTSQALVPLLKRLHFRSVRPDWVLGALIAFLLINGTVHGWNSSRILTQAWGEKAVVGKWILANIGPGKHIGCNVFGSRLVIHYAQGTSIGTAWKLNYDNEAFITTIHKERPDIVVLWENGDLGKSRHTHDAIMRERKKLGYRCVPSKDLTGIKVLVKEEVRHH